MWLPLWQGNSVCGNKHSRLCVYRPMKRNHWLEAADLMVVDYNRVPGYKYYHNTWSLFGHVPDECMQESVYWFFCAFNLVSRLMNLPLQACLYKQRSSCNWLLVNHCLLFFYIYFYIRFCTKLTISTDISQTNTVYLTQSHRFMVPQSLKNSILLLMKMIENDENEWMEASIHFLNQL